MSGSRKTRRSTVVLLAWHGTLPRFSPVVEGGPGRPRSLAIQAALALAMGLYGVHRIGAEGIDSAGPPLFFLACGWGLFLAVWILVKGVLRGCDVEFLLSDRGVEVRPSRRQQELDRGMKTLSHAVFLLTFKGGQWSAWHPATPWKSVRQVVFDEAGQSILIRGGAWTLRLLCGPKEYAPASGIVRERVPARAKLIVEGSNRWPFLSTDGEQPTGMRKAPPGETDDGSAVRHVSRSHRRSTSAEGGTAPRTLSGMGWLFRIGLPLILLAAAVGALAGAARWAVGFIPGIQGMLVGGVLAGLAGRRARLEDARLWGGGQRFWLWLNMLLTCGFVALATLSILQAPPLAGPLEWLADVAHGHASEPFFGVRAINPIHALLGGGWWIGFNVLDLVLFFFLGLVVLGGTVQNRIDPRPPENEGDHDEDDEDEEADKEADVWGGDEDDEDDGDAPSQSGDVADPGPRSPPLARRLLFAQWSVVALVLVGTHVQGERSPAMRFDPASVARLQAYAGRFVFDDGRGLLAPVGKGGSFVVQVWGGNGLSLRSEPGGGYSVSLYGAGHDFRGTMFRGASMISLRARFSEDGRHATLAGPAYRLGRSQGDVAVSARRESVGEGNE